MDETWARLFLLAASLMGALLGALGGYELGWRSGWTRGHLDGGISEWKRQKERERRQPEEAK